MKKSNFGIIIVKIGTIRQKWKNGKFTKKIIIVILGNLCRIVSFAPVFCNPLYGQKMTKKPIIYFLSGK